MTTPPPQEDLFGNPVHPTTNKAPDPSPATRLVNDTDVTQTVLADIASEKTTPLHIDDHGQVRRCTQRTTKPVSDTVSTVVRQLLAAHLVTTRHRSCPGHGAEITTTRAGRNAVSRWRAYRRPSTWGPPPAPTSPEKETRGVDDG